MNPHPKIEHLGTDCPWCDSTGMYLRAAPWSGPDVYVPCGYCKGTGAAHALATAPASGDAP